MDKLFCTYYTKSNNNNRNHHQHRRRRHHHLCLWGDKLNTSNTANEETVIHTENLSLADR